MVSSTAGGASTTGAIGMRDGRAGGRSRMSVSGWAPGAWSPCGVFGWRPPAALVEALSDLLDRGST